MYQLSMTTQDVFQLVKPFTKGENLMISHLAMNVRRSKDYFECCYDSNENFPVIFMNV